MSSTVSSLKSNCYRIRNTLYLVSEAKSDYRALTALAFDPAQSILWLFHHQPLLYILHVSMCTKKKKRLFNNLGRFWPSAFILGRETYFYTLLVIPWIHYIGFQMTKDSGTVHTLYGTAAERAHISGRIINLDPDGCIIYCKVTIAKKIKRNSYFFLLHKCSTVSEWSRFIRKSFPFLLNIL
jgi:hypothetical protein